MKKVYGYARVSTRDQNLDRQLKALAVFGVEERDIVTDKESGKSLEREGYLMLKNHLLREGDTLVVMSLDRLSRKKSHIKTELEYFKEHHIRVKILDIPTTLVELPEEQDWIFDRINNILIEVLASIAEQERDHTLQRQAQGIAAAKEKGKHLGRPKADYPENWDDVYGRWKRGGITARNTMSILNFKRSTADNSKGKPDREDIILQTFEKYGYIFSQDIEQELNVSPATTIISLCKTVPRGLLVKEGTGRQLKYRIAEINSCVRISKRWFITDMADIYWIQLTWKFRNEYEK